MEILTPANQGKTEIEIGRIEESKKFWDETKQYLQKIPHGWTGINTEDGKIAIINKSDEKHYDCYLGIPKGSIGTIPGSVIVSPGKLVIISEGAELQTEDVNEAIDWLKKYE